MSAVATPPPDTGRRSSPDGRRLVAAIGGVMLVLVVVVLVLVLGHTPPPAFLDAAAAPDAARTGQIALLVSGRDTWCLSVVTPADGTQTEVRCERGWVAADEIAWTDRGNIALLGYFEEPALPDEPFPPSGRTVRILDAASGQDLGEGTITDRPAPRWPLGPTVRDDGARLRVTDDGSGRARVVVTDGDGTRRDRLAASGPLDYRFDGASWSPDGNWILVLDSRQRLLVMSSEGEQVPVVVARLSAPGQWLIAPPAWTQPGVDGALVVESSIRG